MLTVAEAAKKAKVSERTMRRYIAIGAVPTVIVNGPKGKEHRIDPDEITKNAQIPKNRKYGQRFSFQSEVEELRAEVSELTQKLDAIESVLKDIQSTLKAPWWRIGK